MPYFGCRTACNKACWGLFGVALAVGLVLLSSGAGTYATCHSKQRHAPAACYQAAAAVMVAGAIVLVLSASCPLYMSSCCAQPPALDSKVSRVQAETVSYYTKYTQQQLQLLMCQYQDCTGEQERGQKSRAATAHTAVAPAAIVTHVFPLSCIAELQACLVPPRHVMCSVSTRSSCMWACLPSLLAMSNACPVQQTYVNLYASAYNILPIITCPRNCCRTSHSLVSPSSSQGAMGRLVYITTTQMASSVGHQVSLPAHRSTAAWSTHRDGVPAPPCSQAATCTRQPSTTTPSTYRASSSSALLACVCLFAAGMGPEELEPHDRMV
jgi:hypothetical protein